MEKTEIEKMIADAIEAALAKPRCAPPLGKWEPNDAEQNRMVVRDVTGMLAQMTRCFVPEMTIVKSFNDRLYLFLKTELQNHWE